MHLEIYADLLFILNFAIDLILLSAVGRIRKKHTRWYRVAGAAAFGGLTSCLSAICGTGNAVLRFFVGYLVIAAILVLIVFGYHSIRDFLINSGILFVVTFLLGGLMESFISISSGKSRIAGYESMGAKEKIPFLVLIFLSLVLTPVIVKVFYAQKKLKEEEQFLYDVTLEIGDDKFSCTGLMDTGNHLYEPITGWPVIIVDKELLRDELLLLQQKKPAVFCVIPFSSVGKKHGMMYGIKLDKVIIRNVWNEYASTHVVCAISEHDFRKHGYRAILHTDLLGS